MSKLDDLLYSRKQYLSDYYNYLSSDGLQDDGKSLVVNGPYTRSVAYKRASAIPSLRVFFKSYPGIPCYFVVDCSSSTGRIVYDDLCNFRSVLKRIDKEIDKYETL